MTDKEKLEKLMKLADAMYYAAQYLTTDASRLHKAMDEYHKFIIHEWREESVSNPIDFEKELYKAFGQVKDFTLGMRIAKWFYDMGKNSQEPVSDDLGEYINELSKQFPEVSFAKLSRIAVRAAKWQKQQNQSTIELAEDHVMLAGMNKMKEEMMENAKSGTVQKDNQVILDDGTYIDLDPSMQLKPSFVGLKEGDRIKVILIKED